VTQPAWIRHPWLSHAFRRRPVCELLVAWQNMRKPIYPTQAATRKVCVFLRMFKRKRPERKQGAQKSWHVVCEKDLNVAMDDRVIDTYRSDG